MGNGIIVCIVAVLTAVYALPQWTIWRDQRLAERERRQTMRRELREAERLVAALVVPEWVTHKTTRRLLVAVLFFSFFLIPVAGVLWAMSVASWLMLVGAVVGVMATAVGLRRIEVLRRQREISSAELTNVLTEAEEPEMVPSGAVPVVAANAEPADVAHRPTRSPQPAETWHPQPVPPPLYSMKPQRPTKPGTPRRREIYTAKPRRVVSASNAKPIPRRRRASGE